VQRLAGPKGHHNEWFKKPGARHVNPVTVRRMIKRGLLKPYLGSRMSLIPVSQLKNLMEKSKASKNGSGKRTLKKAQGPAPYGYFDAASGGSSPEVRG